MTDKDPPRPTDEPPWGWKQGEGVVLKLDAKMAREAIKLGLVLTEIPDKPKKPR